MRYALLDNSTLTGVQRLLGQISIKNKAAIDMDILCLESVLEAILFYDFISVVDDYKPQYRASREANFPKFITLSPENFPYDTSLTHAKNITESIVPKVEAGQFTDDDFKPFFDLLRMNVIFTWDMASSQYWLTQKMLEGVGGIDLEKYSILSSAIRFELTDKLRSKPEKEISDKLILADGKRRRIKTNGLDLVEKSKENAGIAHSAASMFAGLNWLAFRTMFYTVTASNLGVDLFLHPIRQSFQVNFFSKLNQQEPSTFKPLIDALNEQANSTINQILTTSQPFITQKPIPLFVTWFAQKIGDPAKFIEAAYELRETQPFMEARQKLIELESLVKNDNAKFVVEANKLVREIDKTLDTIASKYYANTEQGLSSSNLIMLWNLSTIATKLPMIPEFDIKIPQLEPLKHFLPQKGFKTVYRTLISDLTQVSRLGSLHEKITSRVVLDDEAHYVFEKTENVRFKNYASSWKLPM
jgi:hypothetical protein